MKKNKDYSLHGFIFVLVVVMIITGIYPALGSAAIKYTIEPYSQHGNCVVNYKDEMFCTKENQ